MFSIKTVLTVLPLAALATAIATARSPLLEFEYYPEGVTDCSSGTLGGITFEESSTCRQLGHPAQSFHIGGPSTENQVPPGCKITGYSGTDCSGSVNLVIEGPSDESTCYVVGTFMGQQNPVDSIVFECD